MQEATRIRLAEKSKNIETIQDAKDAQVAVAQALSVLKEFYEGASGATSFAQQPAIFDTPYQGMQAENGGILGMIEVIGSDFMRLETETSAQEESSQKEFDKYMNDSDVDKTQMSKDVEHKTELAGTQKELDAALKYFDKLKPTCVSGGAESFEDRVAQRKEEIESLQEALRILNGEDI